MHRVMVKKLWFLIVLMLALSHLVSADQWRNESLLVDFTYKPSFDFRTKSMVTNVYAQSKLYVPVVGSMRLVLEDIQGTVSNADGITSKGWPYFNIAADTIFADTGILVASIKYPLTRPVKPPIFSPALEVYQNTDCAASLCYEDAVFLTTADMPSRISVNHDNDFSGWTIFDEAQDYAKTSILELFSLLGSSLLEATKTPKLFHAALTKSLSQEIVNENIEYISDYLDYANSMYRGYAIYSHYLVPLQGYDFKYELVKDNSDVIVSNFTPNQVISDIDPLGNNRQPLILIHGWQGDIHDNNYLGFGHKENHSQYYFRELLAFIRNATYGQELLERYKIYLYHYPAFEHITYNGRMLGELINANRELKEYIDGGGKISILAHSMGGLVARSFVEEYGVGQAKEFVSIDHGVQSGTFQFPNQYAGKRVVDKLITLATPHHGSPASMNQWINEVLNYAFISGKNRNTPGALDLFWDDFDNAIKTNFLEKVNFASLFKNDFYKIKDGPNKGDSVFFWRQRATEEINKIGAFDNFHGVSKIPFKNGYWYEEPNPWLAKLNKNLENNGTFGIEYINYGGSLIYDDEFLNKELSYILFVANYNFYFIWNILNESFDNNPLDHIFGWDETGALFGNKTLYILNDAVVPTSSSLFDSLAFGKNWSHNDPYQNISIYLQSNDIDFKDISILRGDSTIGKYRYFHDYDHDKMRGGSGHVDWEKWDNEAGILSYDNPTRWRDTTYSRLIDYNSTIGALCKKNCNLGFGQNRLYNEPLFLSIVKDLGIEIGAGAGFWEYKTGDGYQNYFTVSYDDQSSEDNTTITESSSGLDVTVERPANNCDTASFTAQESLPNQPWQAIYQFVKLGSGSSNFYIWHNTDNYIRFYLSTDDVPYLRIRSKRDGLGPTTTIESSGPYLNKANQFRITWDGDQYRFYLNDIEKGIQIEGDFLKDLDTRVRVNTLTCAWKSADARDLIESVSVSPMQ